MRGKTRFDAERRGAWRREYARMRGDAAPRLQVGGFGGVLLGVVRFCVVGLEGGLLEGRLSADVAGEPGLDFPMPVSKNKKGHSVNLVI
jgi:hypothetical protein